MLKPNVVSNRRHHRPVGREIDCRQRDTASSNRVEELNRNVRSVATRTTIPHRKQTAVAAIHVRDGSRRVDNLLAIPREESVNHLMMMGGLLRYGLEQRCIHRRRVLLLAVQERIQTFKVWIFR